MCTRRFVLAALCAATLAALIAIPSNVGASATHENFVTFSAPVALPGVTLAPGTYLFRSPTEMSSNVVQVLRPDKGRRMISYYMGITQSVERANSDPRSLVSLGEALSGQPTPIKAWFPNGERLGHAFVYSR